jgi:hypothetical protein
MKYPLRYPMTPDQQEEVERERSYGTASKLLQHVGGGQMYTDGQGRIFIDLASVLQLRGPKDLFD